VTAGPGRGAGWPALVVGVALNAAVDKTAAVDGLTPGGIHRPRLLSAVPGGKATNVVRAAASLGVPGRVVAVLGGHAGAWFRASLAERGIGLVAVEVDGETRTCLSVLDEATGELTEFYEPGLTLAELDWPRVEDALASALEADGAAARDALVVLSGSLPPGAPRDAYARLVRVAHASGARAVVDAEGDTLGLALDAAPWLVKVTAHESESVTGESARTLPRAARAGEALRARGAELAIVTRGVHGAVLVAADGAWAVGGIPARARGRFTVGSGDAFLAGLAAALRRGDALPDALRWAAAAGAANAQLPGQGELDPQAVPRIAAMLEVTRLDGR